MDKKGIIDAVREGFDGRLHSEEYRRAHSDAEHLKNLLALIAPSDGDRILDLGTGNGYLAFELAKRYPRIRVRGLDIAKGSYFVLSDPLTLDEDEAGFAVEREFASEVRVPRALDERHRALLAERGPALAAMYGIEIQGEEVFMRCSVMNIRFKRVS